MVAISSAVALNEGMLRNSVTWFSSQALGVPYSQLTRMIYPRPPYKHFTITKRNGSPRAIAEPRKRLKIVQEQVLAFLEERSGAVRPAVHGFVANRSIVTNAKVHCSPKTHQILNLDLQDFFPSITFYRVRGVLRKHPFNFSHHVATVIAHICTLDGKLPQGAPTSPFLSNLVCRSMDRDLTELARRNRATYTRYADDITFSFHVRTASRLPAAVCVVDDDGHLTLGAELHDLITAKHHFAINAAKTRLSDRGRRMEVTGLTINKFPNVRRIFIDRIRGALNAWERNGYEAAEQGWQDRVINGAKGPYEKRPWKRQTRGRVIPKLKNVLWGKLLYLRMVRGKEDVLYTRLAERFNAMVDLEQSSGSFSAPKLPVEQVVRDHDTAQEGVFVVEWEGDYHSSPGHHDDVLMAHGTAFAYRELNLLVTCNHVFEVNATARGMEWPTDFEAPEVVNKSLNLVRPGTKETWPARIVHRNKQFDFAILQFEEPAPPHRYFSAMDTPIRPRADGILIGFPAYKNWNLPDQNDQKVLNRTEPNRGMISFTISGAGSIRPGNSGGPFTDDRFRVAGMAQRGAYMGDGHDECLCFEIMDTFVATWKAESKASLAPMTSAVPVAIATPATLASVSTLDAFAALAQLPPTIS